MYVFVCVVRVRTYVLVFLVCMHIKMCIICIDVWSDRVLLLRNFIL